MATSIVPVSTRQDTREHGDAINRVVYRDNGAENAQVVWKNNQAGYIQTIVNAEAAGDALAVLLPATAATATPTPANAILLVNATGVLIGDGKALRLYDPAGADYAQLTSDADGGLVLGGSGANAGILVGDWTVSGNLQWKSGTANIVTLDHAATAARTITVPDATDTLALLAQTQSFSGQNTFSNATAPIISVKVGPSSTQQHTLPAVTSDTVALLAATQTLTATMLSAGILTGTTNVSGGQLQFPAAQSASADANTLDDYEELTWTPTIGGSATYTLQAGLYTKIGRVVYVSARFIINAVGTGSVSTISGLPFTAASNGRMGVTVHYWAGSATNYVYLSGLVSGTTIILQAAVAAAAALGTATFFANGADICFSGFYVV